MAEIINYKLNGVKETLDAISALDNKTIINIVRTIERKALNQFVIRPLKSACPYSSLKSDGIGILGSRNERMKYWAGIKTSKRTDANTPPAGAILIFLEGGTKERIVKKKRVVKIGDRFVTLRAGASLGAITPRPFASPIIDNAVEPIINMFANDFAKEVSLQLEKRLKKVNKQ